jgi:addiction module HigA family antidote
MNILEAKKLLLTCPGATIQENIDYIGMTQAELAMRMGRSKEKLNELINGKAAITQDTAIKLEYVLGIPSDFWLALEKKYQEDLLKIERLEFLQSCQAWLKRFPIKKMKQLKVLPEIDDKAMLVESLLKFFRVASPKEWDDVYRNLPLAFKIQASINTEKEAISVWLRYGEIQAEKIPLNAFDKKGFKEHLYVAQEISYKQAENWQVQLQDFCANYGIALVYTPCISKAPIYGATRWIKTHTTPILQISDCNKDVASFWFTFFHECGHIILHGKKDIFMEGIEGIQQDATKEQQADDFSIETLLPKLHLKELTMQKKITLDDIQTYSDKFNINKGILVAQLLRQKAVNFKEKNAQMFIEKIALECS